MVESLGKAARQARFDTMRQEAPRQRIASKMRDDARMTIAAGGHQHPMTDFPAIVEDRVPGKRGHFTIRFLHDQIRRRKVPVAAVAARKSGIEMALRDPTQPERKRSDTRMQRN